MKQHPWYSYDRLFSFNATFMGVCGARGVGKSYGGKVKLIRKSIDNKRQFILLRRFKDELAVAKGSFFADIQQEFPDYDFRSHTENKLALGQAAHISTRDDKKRVWQTICYFMSLSVSQNQKSQSFPFVDYILFDEFIIEKGLVHYLPNEAVVLTNFYSTVDRGQDRVKVLMLSNSVSIMNPYFTAWNIEPKQGQEFIKRHKLDNGRHYVVFHFPDSEAFKESIYETAFGKFIQGTEYADYALENQFADNDDALIAIKDPKARYQFSLETKAGTFSVWHNIFLSEYTIMAKRPKQEIVLTLVASKMSEDKKLIPHNDYAMQALRTAFRQARVTFDRPSTRNTFAEIFNR